MTWLSPPSAHRMLPRSPYRLLPRSASSLLLRRAVPHITHAEGPEPGRSWARRPEDEDGEPAGPLAIEVDVSQDATTVFISGELDLVTTPILAEQLARVARSEPERLVLDMAGTGFMDCGSARVIATAARSRPAGRRLVIRSPRPGVRRVLELTGVDADCEIEG
jgi:anti-sigma B factor antagonist